MFFELAKRLSTAKTNVDLILYYMEMVRRIDTLIAKSKTSFINVGNEFNVYTYRCQNDPQRLVHRCSAISAKKRKRTQDYSILYLLRSYYMWL